MARSSRRSGTQSESRRSSIAELLEKEDFPTTGEFAARALTLDGAKQYLSRKLSTSASSPAREVPVPPRPPVPAARTQVGSPVNWVEAAPYRPPPPPRPGLATGPALCEAEERLRRGWVSVRGEQLLCLETEMHSVLWALHNAQEALRIYTSTERDPPAANGGSTHPGVLLRVRTP